MSLQQPGTFKELFIAKIKTMLDVEQQLVSALPKMAEAATDPELKQGFSKHFEETKQHADRIEQVFKSLDLTPAVEDSDTIRGMVSDAEWCIENIQESNVLDAALISAARGVENYEMMLYTTAGDWAQLMGLADVQKIFETTLAEEDQADETLALAGKKIYKLAFQETADTEEEESKGILGFGKMETGNI